MKIKLLVLAAAISPAMALVGQNAVFYNQGKMVVKGTDPANTVLYINGDFVSGSSSDKSTTSQITLDKSRTVLTGDFKHNALAPASEVFVDVAAVTAPSTADAVFEFRGVGTTQHITTSGTTYATIPNKGDSFINFPTLLINNPDSVLLDPALAVQTVNLDLPKGTFSLGAERITAANQDRYFSDALKTGSNPDERSVLAHLKVTGSANYTNMTAANLADRGFVRVTIPLDPSGSYTNANSRFGSIVGFGIPFQGLQSDYFTWNFLTTPVGNSKSGPANNYFGPDNFPVIRRDLQLKPGVGYIVGNELRGDQYSDYATDNTVVAPGNLTEDQFNSRFKGEYIFDRALFAGKTNSNSTVGIYDTNKTATAYTQEKLNTEGTGTGVQVNIYPGYNYLANPYTSPLDISALLQDSPAVLSEWGVKPGTTSGNRDIVNRVWVMSGTSRGTAKYSLTDPTLVMYQKLQFNVNTNVANPSGSTYTNPDGSMRTIIPPLQMFIIYSEVEKTITIPKSAQTMGEVAFIRSADNSYDDFVFEVVDSKTATSDRASIVLRSQADLISNTGFTNVVKMNAVGNTEKTATGSALEQGVSSQLYTMSETGNPLLVKYQGYAANEDNKVSVPLYLKPSSVDQDVVIRGYRLNTLTNFESIILVDKLLGKEVYMTADTEYPTTIKSTDADDRFVLIFSRGTVGIEDDITNPSSKSINSYYSNSVLTVNGFDESDYGSKLTVYDIQGRQVAHATVNDFEVKIISDFAPGAFIVKVAGNNNSYVAKFLVK